ncbi:hypothetical protein [Desulfobacula sp.]|nr:hypothetical protein [Desulfobacula sp.]
MQDVLKFLSDDEGALSVIFSGLVNFNSSAKKSPEILKPILEG